MPFMDKMKAGAAQAAQKAQQAAKAGQAKFDLGAAVYAQRTGSGDANAAGEIDRLVAALKEHEEAAAAAAEAAAAPASTAPDSGSAPAAGGDFKLDD
jgi:hypothetical protein